MNPAEVGLLFLKEHTMANTYYNLFGIETKQLDEIQFDDLKEVLIYDIENNSTMDNGEAIETINKFHRNDNNTVLIFHTNSKYSGSDLENAITETCDAYEVELDYFFEETGCIGFGLAGVWRGYKNFFLNDNDEELLDTLLISEHLEIKASPAYDIYQQLLKSNLIDGEWTMVIDKSKFTSDNEFFNNNFIFTIIEDFVFIQYK